MTIREFYEAVGGDYGGTLGRFLSEERMQRFAFRFESDPSYAELCAALESGNTAEAFRAAHTLKGVCQNLGFDGLFKPTSEATEILRAGSMKVEKQMAEIRAEYEKIMSAIEQLKESNG